MNKINLSGVNEIVYHEVLDNGLNIYMLPNKNVKNYYITFTTKFGACDIEFKSDKQDNYIKVPNGVAHFLEHLTFKMENGMDASDYFASLGCQANAYTSTSETCYEVYGYKNFKEALNYLLEYVQTPYYTKENVEAEKGIICEEIKMRSDNPMVKLHETINKSLFKNNNRKYQIAGTIKDVQNTTLNNILDCYNTFYHPSNMFIVITGNFNPNEASAIIYENQSNKNFGEPIKIKRKRVSEIDSVVEEYTELEANVELEKASVSLKIPIEDFKDLNLTKEELSIYVSIIINSNFGRSSELREELVSGNIITDGPYITKYFTDEHLIISIMAETEYPKKFISMIKEQIAKLDITEKDLVRKQRVALSNYIVTFDSIDEINGTIVNDIIQYDKLIDNLYDIYVGLNIDTSKKIVKKLITDNISVVVLNKKNEE